MPHSTQLRSCFMRAMASTWPYFVRGMSARHLHKLERGEAVVAALANAGAVVDKASTDGGLGALYLAAQGGHVSIVSALLEAGAEVDHGNDDGQTPLLAAAGLGHAAVVKMLLEAGADANQVRAFQICAMSLRIWPRSEDTQRRR